jgi:hypothetical protein
LKHWDGLAATCQLFGTALALTLALSSHVLDLVAYGNRCVTDSHPRGLY